MVFPAHASVPAFEEIRAEAVVLMDADTGQVLYEKNANSRRHPASITKLMTGLLVLENLAPDETITASETAVDLPSWSSSAYLKAGESITVEQTMYAMMLRSGNDAANVLAGAIDGSEVAFAARMNERARELGADNTAFSNPHGLPERGHMTTAYDMALITREAIKTPGFLFYIGAATYSMPETNRNDARIFTNTHKMLLSGYSQYDKTVIGGKTGYTAPSGYTLATVAQREGRTLICVVLDSDTIYADTEALLDLGFGEFVPHTYSLEGEVFPRSVPVWD